MAKQIVLTEVQIEFLDNVKKLVESYTREDIHEKIRSNAIVYARYLFTVIVTSETDNYNKFTEEETALYLGVNHATINHYKNVYRPPYSHLKDLKILNKYLTLILSNRVPVDYVKNLLIVDKISIEDLIDATIESKKMNEYQILVFADSLKRHCLNRIIDKVKN